RVLILVPVLRIRRRVNPDVNFGFSLAVPCRYPMPPPHLSADAPVADVLYPLRVNLLPVRWKKTDEMIADDSQRFFRFRVAQEPLLADTRLNRHIASIAEPDIVFVRLSLRQYSPRLQ